MALSPLKIAVLHYQPGGEPIDPVVLHITDALTELGHEAVTIAVHDRVFDILTEIERSQCDLVFNVCETFADDYRMEVNVAALMEMAQVKFTGSGTAGLLARAGQDPHQAAARVPRGAARPNFAHLRRRDLRDPRDAALPADREAGEERRLDGDRQALGGATTGTSSPSGCARSARSSTTRRSPRSSSTAASCTSRCSGARPGRRSSRSSSWTSGAGTRTCPRSPTAR